MELVFALAVVAASVVLCRATFMNEYNPVLLFEIARQSKEEEEEEVDAC